MFDLNLTTELSPVIKDLKQAIFQLNGNSFQLQEALEVFHNVQRCLHSNGDGKDAAIEALKDFLKVGIADADADADADIGSTDNASSMTSLYYNALEDLNRLEEILKDLKDSFPVDNDHNMEGYVKDAISRLEEYQRNNSSIVQISDQVQKTLATVDSVAGKFGEVPAELEKTQQHLRKKVTELSRNVSRITEANTGNPMELDNVIDRLEKLRQIIFLNQNAETLALSPIEEENCDPLESWYQQTVELYELKSSKISDSLESTQLEHQKLCVEFIKNIIVFTKQSWLLKYQHEEELKKQIEKTLDVVTNRLTNDGDIEVSECANENLSLSLQELYELRSKHFDHTKKTIITIGETAKELVVVSGGIASNFEKITNKFSPNGKVKYFTLLAAGNIMLIVSGILLHNLKDANLLNFSSGNYKSILVLVGFIISFGMFAAASLSKVRITKNQELSDGIKILVGIITVGVAMVCIAMISARIADVIKADKLVVGGNFLTESVIACSCGVAFFGLAILLGIGALVIQLLGYISKRDVIGEQKVTGRSVPNEEGGSAETFDNLSDGSTPGTKISNLDVGVTEQGNQSL